MLFNKRGYEMKKHLILGLLLATTSVFADSQDIVLRTSVDAAVTMAAVDCSDHSAPHAQASIQKSMAAIADAGSGVPSFDFCVKYSSNVAEGYKLEVASSTDFLMKQSASHNSSVGDGNVVASSQRCSATQFPVRVESSLWSAGSFLAPAADKTGLLLSSTGHIEDEIVENDCSVVASGPQEIVRLEDASGLKAGSNFEEVRKFSLIPQQVSEEDLAEGLFEQVVTVTISTLL
jgi:hypothetical protein